MHFDPNHVYHVYSRGNNRTRIFFNDANYLYLLRKVKEEWLKFCEIFAYCLMPNHFHFMLQVNDLGCEGISVKNRVTDLQNLSKTIGKTLSSYTRGINIQNKTIGSLFQKKTKAKCLTDMPLDSNEFSATEYLLNCFHYIHYNPLKASCAQTEIGPFFWPEYGLQE